MSRREDRERKIAGWLEHLEGWKASGEALSRYARSHGIEAGSMYYWRSVLRGEGRWPEGKRSNFRVLQSGARCLLGVSARTSASCKAAREPPQIRPLALVAWPYCRLWSATYAFQSPYVRNARSRGAASTPFRLGQGTL